jgi:acyl-ACP thioesterase
MAKQIVWEQEIRVNTLLVNPQQRLGLVGLLSVMQDAAWEHAAHSGFGRADLEARGVYWVLTRQKLKMEAWPRWGETFTLRTWGRPFEGFIARRDFEFSSRGRLIGSCATEWLNLDAGSHRPVRLRLEDSVDSARQDHRLDYDPAKVDPKGEWECLAVFDVRNSDQDMQGHVNNVRYAQWVLDAVPAGQHRTHVLREYEANFLAETRLGDRVEVQNAPPECGEGGRGMRRFLGVRQGDGKPVFACRLGLEPAVFEG